MEMEDLEQRLQGNYYCVEDLDEDLAKDILEYINNNPVEDLKDESIFLMKGFSKNCSNIITSGIDLTKYDNKTPGFSVEQLKWIYSFNQQILLKIDSSFFSKSCEEDIDNIYTHLFAHNSNLAKKLAEIVEEPKDKFYWLMTACIDLEKSIQLSDGKDAVYCANQVGFKGNIRLKIAELVTDVDNKKFWLRKTSLDFEESIKRFEEIGGNEEHIGYTHTKRANVLSKLAELIIDDDKEKVYYFKKSYESNIEGAKLVKKVSSRHSAMSFMCAGKDAYEIYKITGDDEFRVNAITNYSIFINYFNKHPDINLNNLHNGVCGALRELKNTEDNGSDYIDEMVRGRKPNKPRYKSSKRFRKFKK